MHCVWNFCSVSSKLLHQDVVEGHITSHRAPKFLCVQLNTHGNAPSSFGLLSFLSTNSWSLLNLSPGYGTLCFSLTRIVTPISIRSPIFAIEAGHSLLGPLVSSTHLGLEPHIWLQEIRYTSIQRCIYLLLAFALRIKQFCGLPGDTCCGSTSISNQAPNFGFSNWTQIVFSPELALHNRFLFSRIHQSPPQLSPGRLCLLAALLLGYGLLGHSWALKTCPLHSTMAAVVT